MNTEANLSEFDKNLDANRHGLICIILLIVGCLGGITVGLGAINNVFTLILVVVPTMTTLSLLLAVAPMRWILTMTYVSVIIDVLLLTYFLLIA
jgi:hypothetical protein